jgi:hypothetical protein
LPIVAASGLPSRLREHAGHRIKMHATNALLSADERVR